LFTSIPLTYQSITMKGISAVAPLAVALSATVVSASAIPDTLIPSYFKRATSLPEVTVKGNGTNASPVSETSNAKRSCQPFSPEAHDSTSAVSTTSQVRRPILLSNFSANPLLQAVPQMLLTQLLLSPPALGILLSKRRKFPALDETMIADIDYTGSRN